MMTSHLLVSPALSSHSTRFANIQQWLAGVIQVDPLQSPIRLSDQQQHPSLSVSRRKHCCSSFSVDDYSIRSARRLRVSQRSRNPWTIPPSRRFFDSANWLDDADEKLSSLPAEHPQWRDAYTVMISQPRSRVRRSLRCQASPQSPTSTILLPIVLPVCPPLNLMSPPCTPVQSHSSLPKHISIPDTPVLTPCDSDRVSPAESSNDMLVTPHSEALT